MLNETHKTLFALVIRIRPLYSVTFYGNKFYLELIIDSETVEIIIDDKFKNHILKLTRKT